MNALMNIEGSIVGSWKMNIYQWNRPSDYSTYIEDVDGIVLEGEIKSYDYESDEYNLFD